MWPNHLLLWSWSQDACNISYEENGFHVWIVILTIDVAFVIFIQNEVHRQRALQRMYLQSDACFQSDKEICTVQPHSAPVELLTSRCAQRSIVHEWPVDPKIYKEKGLTLANSQYENTFRRQLHNINIVLQSWAYSKDVQGVSKVILELYHG